MSDDLTAVREDIQAAYSFVEGHKSQQQFSTLTLSDCYQQYIQRIESPGTDTRPNALQRIRDVQRRLKSAIEKVKALPPDTFNRKDNANTAADTEED